MSLAPITPEPSSETPRHDRIWFIHTHILRSQCQRLAETLGLQLLRRINLFEYMSSVRGQLNLFEQVASKRRTVRSESKTWNETLLSINRVASCTGSLRHFTVSRVLQSREVSCNVGQRRAINRVLDSRDASCKVAQSCAMSTVVRKPTSLQCQSRDNQSHPE